MRKTITAIAFVSIAFFVACNDNAGSNAGQDEDASAVREEQQSEGVRLGMESGEAIDPTVAPQGTGNVAPAEGGQALNPPHGQPGHRCEIPVGAPLNSDPVNSGDLVQQQIKQDHAQPITIHPQQQSAAPASGNNSGARLNPPHGQPGHDCAVAVGAPLP